MQSAQVEKQSQPRVKSQTHRAVEIIREMILNNTLPAGSSHLETELAERLGMSRTPVREATLILESQGLLKVRPRRGVQITQLSAEDMDEIYQILTELESLAAEILASKGLSEDEFEELERPMRDMEAALERGDREGWAAADASFHDELVRLAGNSRITSVISTFNDQVQRARLLTLHIRPLPTKSNEDHRLLLEAIKARDPAKAREIHRAHRVAAKVMMLELLSNHGFHRV